MFKNLLVPLDGSSLAESSLPAAKYLAAKLKTQVTLLHVIERKPPQRVHGQKHLADVTDAESYLTKKVGWFGDPGVSHHVHTDEINDVARSIVVHAEEMQTDLILMCAHGTGGIRHGLFGTVVQRVIELGKIPVLVLPGSEHAARPFACERIMLPLDGNPEHEQALAGVQPLGDSSALQILLMMVIPTRSNVRPLQRSNSRTMPTVTTELLDAACQPALDYLETHRKSLQEKGHVVSTRIVRGDAMKEVVATANAFDADLIAMTTHGPSYFNAFWSESLPARFLGTICCPLLLFPATKS